MLLKMTKAKYPANLDVLVQDMEKHPELYKHLKIFLRHENYSGIPDFGEEYLAVSHNVFVLYRLDSIDYHNGSITISLTEATTCKPVAYTPDITDERPSCLFLRWKDIRSMVFQGCLNREVDEND
jgi:hypothetical protein